MILKNQKLVVLIGILSFNILGYAQSQKLQHTSNVMQDIARIYSTNIDSTNSSNKNLSDSVKIEKRIAKTSSVEFKPEEKEPRCDIRKLQMSIVYPDSARRAGIEGKVIIRVLVGEDGKLRKTKVEYSDNEMLNQAALDAITNGGIFEPGVYDGKPIECWVSIPIVFKLRSKNSTNSSNKNLSDSVKIEKRIAKTSSVEFNSEDMEPNCDMRKLQMSVVYPDSARRAGIEGKVIVSVLVGEDGKLRKTKVEYSDSEMLNQAALDAIANVEIFTPAIHDGKPIACWVSFPIVFKLR